MPLFRSLANLEGEWNRDILNQELQAVPYEVNNLIGRNRPTTTAKFH